MVIFGRHFTLTRYVAGSAAIALATLAGCSADDDGDTTGATSTRLSSVPTFNVAKNETSTSGLSSGAYMAVQVHVAFSSIMRGAGIFAGGPYECARGQIAQALTTCMSSTSVPDAASYVQTTKSYASSGAIDPIANLAGQKIFLFSGANDNTVNPAVMDGLEGYYAALVGKENIAFERKRAATGHTMPTEDYGASCASTTSPYVGDCAYDGAGHALAQIYGPLAPKATKLGGTFLTIPQADFVAAPASHSLADKGYAYVPKSCLDGETCRIHVAFHGCKQYATSPAGDAFYKHAGYNEWADTNHIIVLYPQTIALDNGNPNGCWDWWGYDSAAYAKKTGPQMAMVKKMIDHLASGSNADGGLPPEDAGSAPDASAEGPSDAGAPRECVVASNVEHVAAGRAELRFGFVVAKGSNHALGAYSYFVRTGVQKTGSDAWALSLTGCL